jgi:hypothetical protein
LDVSGQLHEGDRKKFKSNPEIKIKKKNTKLHVPAHLPQKKKFLAPVRPEAVSSPEPI